MAIALITGAHASAHSTGPSTGATTSAVDTSGANFIGGATVWYGGGAVNCPLTDNKGNTWTGKTQQSVPGDTKAQIFYCVNPTVGSGHTFSVNTATSYSSVFAAAFSGVDTSSAFDVEAGSQGSGAGSYTTATITPTQDGDLVISFIGAGNAPTSGGFTVDSSFSHLDDINYVAGQNYGGSLGYLIQGAHAGISPKWSYSGTSAVAAPSAAFKAAAGGGATAKPPWPFMRGMTVH